MSSKPFPGRGEWPWPAWKPAYGSPKPWGCTRKRDTGGVRHSAIMANTRCVCSWKRNWQLFLADDDRLVDAVAETEIEPGGADVSGSAALAVGITAFHLGHLL